MAEAAVRPWRMTRGADAGEGVTRIGVRDVHAGWHGWREKCDGGVQVEDGACAAFSRPTGGQVEARFGYRRV